MYIKNAGRWCLILFLTIPGCGDNGSHGSRESSEPPVTDFAVAPPFVLVSPPDGAAGESTAPTLRWTDATAEDGYALDVATDAAFAGVVYTREDLPPDTTQFALPLGTLAGGTRYYWRARAIRGADRETPSNAPFSLIPGSWAKSYGGTNNDSFVGIAAAPDDGYVMADRTASFGAGGNDVWVLSLQATGSVSWEKAYGGTGTDQAQAVGRTPDGGFVVAGSTNSFGAGGYDVWILRLASNGSIVWQKTYGGTGQDYAQSVAITGDGGCLIGGYTNSFGAGLYDYWALKLRADGSLDWQETFGGSGNDYLYGVCATLDGGYVLVGRTFSFRAGSSDGWVVKLNAGGSAEWQATYGSAATEYLRSVREDPDGAQTWVGTTDSFGAGLADIWVIHAGANGTPQWQKTYGGTGADDCFGIADAGDGGYVLGGQTASYGAGLNDAWLLRLTSAGAVSWQRAYGGAQNDFAYGLFRNRAGEFAVAGKTQSFGAGGADAWVLKIDADGTLPALGVTTTATSTNTSVIPQDTSAAGQPTSVIPLDTDATVTDTVSVVGNLSP